MFPVGHVCSGLCYVGCDHGSHPYDGSSANGDAVSDACAQTDENVWTHSHFSTKYNSGPYEDVVGYPTVMLHDGTGIDDAMLPDRCTVDYRAVKNLSAFPQSAGGSYDCGRCGQYCKTVVTEAFDYFSS